MYTPDRGHGTHDRFAKSATINSINSAFLGLLRRILPFPDKESMHEHRGMIEVDAWNGGGRSRAPIADQVLANPREQDRTGSRMNEKHKNPLRHWE